MKLEVLVEVKNAGKPRFRIVRDETGFNVEIFMQACTQISGKAAWVNACHQNEIHIAMLSLADLVEKEFQL